MNSVILKNSDLIEGENHTYLLSKEVSLHLKETVKVSLGDTLKATILNESQATATVIHIDDQVTVEVTETKEGLHFPIHLIVGASRPPTMKKVLEHGTSLGVSAFHILKGELSQKSYLQSKIYEGEKLTELLHLGLSQSVVFTNEPSLRKSKFISELNLPETPQRFILSPYATEHITDIDFDINQESVFAVGPERGWTNNELESFRNLGFKEIKISPSILRVEVATLALLGAVNQKM